MRMILIVAVILLAWPADVRAQAGTVHQSYARARALLDSAITAHGGQAALDAVRQVRVQLSGSDHWRNQSRAPGTTFDREPARHDLMIDLARGRLIATIASTYPGDIHRQWRWITAGDSSFTVDLRAHTWQRNQFPRAEAQTGNLFRLPQWLLIKAHESGFALRSLGRMRLAGGAEVEAITTNTQNQQLTIGFDPTTKLVRAYMWTGNDAVLGAVPREQEYVDYRPLNGLLMPARMIERVGHEVRRDYTYDVLTPGFQVHDSIARPPAVTTLAAAELPVPPVRALAPGVWLVGSGSQALVAEFRDHVLVVDAPPNARDIRTRIDSLAPGKPIRYVVPTHHHDDHSTGVREFAARGATIISAAANRAFFQQVAPTARIETLEGARRVFSDGQQTVEIHQVGPSPHANDMYVAWLPAHGIVFQGDLIDTRADGSIVRGANNATTVHFAKWLKGKGWRVRTYAGTHGTLPDADVFGRLLAQPVF